MPNFLAFVHAGISAPSSDTTADGRELASQCRKKLESLGDDGQFPPKLLVLMTSPTFLDSDRNARVINGIYEIFGIDVPLIGSSAAAVFCDNKIHADGALLICLASRIIRAEVGVVENANRRDADKVTDELISHLKLSSNNGNKSAEHLPHLLLLTFFPGTGSTEIESRHSTELLHDLLWKKVHSKIRHIAGGVSSSNDPYFSRPGQQFRNQDVYEGALATAVISSGAPFGENLSNGVVWNDDVFMRVKQLSDDKSEITEFEEGIPADRLRGQDKLVLFREAFRSTDRIMAVSDPQVSPRSVRNLRPVLEGNILSPGTLTKTNMYRNAETSIQSSLATFRIENPIGCISIKCTSHLRYQELLGLKIEDGITSISKTKLKSRPYVGAFFDGEIGMDKTGRSTFGNWGVVTVVMGDEMSDRCLIQRAYSSMNAHSASLSSSLDLGEVLKESLMLISDVGFSGGMISLILPDNDKFFIRGSEAIGPRFNKITSQTIRDVDGEDILAKVARKSPDASRFIADSEKDDSCEKSAVSISGIISQYIIRLQDSSDTATGLLQVDLGNCRHKHDLYRAEEEVLESIGGLISANINRVFSWNENEIARKLDESLIAAISQSSLSEGLNLYLKRATEAFGLGMGHIRLMDKVQSLLVLKAGLGPYYEAALKYRPHIPLGESQTDTNTFTDSVGRAVIVNNVPENQPLDELAAQYSDKLEMVSALEKVRSFATIAFTDSEHRTMGTVTLISDQIWFFHNFHKRALAALAKRMTLLVEHFVGKERDHFLQAVTPNLSAIPDFNDVKGMIDSATKEICKALRAERAGLYLWEGNRDRTMYVLHSVYNWSDPDCAGSAFYMGDETWIGNLAAPGPLYTADLFRKYESLGCLPSTKRYDEEVFGRPLSDEFTVEALALPLKVEREVLGVLTAYCEVADPHTPQPSKFSTIDPAFLQRAIDPFAGLIKLARDHQLTGWIDRQKDQRTGIYEALPSQGNRNFEARTCRQLIRSLSASRVDFYKMLDRPDDQKTPSWVTGCEIRGEDVKLGRRPRQNLDTLLVSALNSPDKAFCHEIVTSEDGRQYKGIVDRACVPLIASGVLVGILDLSWDPNIRQKPPLVGESGESHLSQVGRMIGSAYNRNNLTVTNEKTGIALRGLTYGISSSHTLANHIVRLKAWAQSLREPLGVTMVGHTAVLLEQAAQSIEDEITKNVAFFKEIIEGKEQRVDLHQRLEALVDRYQRDNRHLRLSTEFDRKVFVGAVPEMIDELFKILINNSLKAITDWSGGGRIAITSIPARLLDKDGDLYCAAQISVKDNGVGLPDHIKQLLPRISKGELVPYNGRDQRHMFGLFFAHALARIMGGTLNHESDEEVRGTNAIIMLPIAETEDAQ